MARVRIFTNTAFFERAPTRYSLAAEAGSVDSRSARGVLCICASALRAAGGLLGASPAMARALLACLLALAVAAQGEASLRPGGRPRAALGGRGSFQAGNCSVLFDAAGTRLPPSSPCARCEAPWLQAVAQGALLCRCMGDCVPAPSRSAAVVASAARAAAAALAPPGNWTDAWDDAAAAARGVRLVVGMGTGRCGTVTLARLLRSQAGSSGTFSHEQHPLLPWSPLNVDAALRSADARVRLLLTRRLRWRGDGGGADETPLVGDVASFYLPYAELLLRIEPTARFLVLQRERDAVVRSFMSKDPGVDLWRSCADRGSWQPNSVYWAAAHPKYACSGAGGATSTAEALGMYWDEYAERVEALRQRFPDRVRVEASPALFEDEEAQRKALHWAGFQQPKLQPSMPRHNCIANCGDGDKQAVRGAG
jgi:hypothetical protein